MQQNKYKILTILFTNFSSITIEKLSNFTEDELLFKRGEVVIKEEDEGEKIYFLFEGNLIIEKTQKKKMVFFFQIFLIYLFLLLFLKGKIKHSEWNLLDWRGNSIK